LFAPYFADDFGRVFENDYKNVGDLQEAETIEEMSFKDDIANVFVSSCPKSLILFDVFGQDTIFCVLQNVG
jgi:hypothetical protein